MCMKETKVLHWIPNSLNCAHLTIWMNLWIFRSLVAKGRGRPKYIYRSVLISEHLIFLLCFLSELEACYFLHLKKIII